MANEFSSQCAVAVNNSYGTVGSIAKSNLQFFTPTSIRDIFGASSRWAERQHWITQAFEMNSCGTRRMFLYDWITSSMRNGANLLNIRKGAKTASLIEPFVWGRQMSVNNTDAFYVTANVSGGAYSGSLTGVDSGSRVLTVKSTFLGANFVAHADYFLPGKRVFQILNGAGNVFSITQWEVVQAAVKSGDTTAIDIEVVQKQATTGQIPSSTSATNGIILRGQNNVHDVEAWCKNMHNVILEKRVPFWYSTRRRVRSISSVYRDIYEKLWADNAYYRTFADLPMAERNAQDEQRDRAEWIHSFFFGTAISDNQTLSSWENLSSITSVNGATVDPGTGNQLIAKRAEMIGVIPQLKGCGQFADSAAADLDIRTFLESDIYDLYRARESHVGRSNVNEIDLWMNSTAADQFMQAFIAYNKTKLGDVVRINIEDAQTSWGWPYRRFKLHKPAGRYINVFSDFFFDDLATQASTASAGSVGNMIMALDVGQGGSIYPMILGSNRKMYRSGQVEDLAKVDSTFSCVMENPTIERSLYSETMTTVVECPSDSKVWANFGNVSYTAP